jgi:hypothetical protein
MSSHIHLPLWIIDPIETEIGIIETIETVENTEIEGILGIGDKYSNDYKYVH